MRPPARLPVVLTVLLLVIAAGCTATMDEASEWLDGGRRPLAREVVSVDGRRLAVHDNCHAEPRLAVVEDADEVRIRFNVAELTGGDCFSCTVVELAEEVGDRRVVDAVTGQPVPTDGDCFTVLDL